MRETVFVVAVILLATGLSQVESAVWAALGVAVMLAAPIVWVVHELGRGES